MKRVKKKRDLQHPPTCFRPLLWSLDWENVDIVKDKEDIIVNTINDGTLSQWQWLKNTYGEHTICHILKRRLKSEFYPESRQLARVVFGVSTYVNARKSARVTYTKNFSTPLPV